jgi:2-keto-3-deoxy-L-rhamnonate aldolase RhmA
MPKSGEKPSAHLYPEGGPGRQLKKRLKAGEVLVGGIIFEYSRPPLVRFYQQAGFDFIYIEYEHMFMDPSSLVDTVQCARDNGLPVIAKPPTLDQAQVAKLMECGVVGLQLPRTGSREEIATLIDWVRYTPVGHRSLASGYGNSDYVPPDDKRAWMDEQNEEITVVAMIETRQGYENAEEIISTPGVDMLYVGPGDFSVEMGQPGDAEHADVRGPIEEIIEICKKHGVPFGTTAANLEATKRYIGMGASFFETADERTLIIEGATKIVEEYREILG